MGTKFLANNEKAPAMGVARAQMSKLNSDTGNDAMNDNTSLIAIEPADIGGQVIETVNARDLHAFLEVKAHFKDWVARRIAEYGFIDGQDFCSELSKTPSGGRPSKEYHLSLDMAKELSMVERNEKGKQARQYFIECERQAKAQPVADPMQALSDPATMRELLLGYSEKVLALESTVQEQAPKVAALDRLSTAEGSLCLTDAAKHLQERPKDLIHWLHANDWIYRRAGNKNWVAYQPRIKQGVLIHKITTVSLDDGTEKTCEQVRVTPKGLTRLAEIFQGVAA